jgi:SAM-dependent methyltransferase
LQEHSSAFKDLRLDDPRLSAHGLDPAATDHTPPDIRDLKMQNEWLRLKVAQYKDEENTYGGDYPITMGTGLIAEIVPPIASSRIRADVGSPTLAGHLLVADTWLAVLSRYLKEQSTLLDMGCGCGKDARNLLHHPYVKTYIGFDVHKPNIDWCRHSLVPRSGERFEFHYVDVYSAGYNPEGKVRGTEVAFPAGDGTIDLAFAASLFTHLLEPDARHYLREVRRVMAPHGLFLPTIHTNPSPGSAYSGDEIRIDVAPEYFIRLAQEAGLRLVESLGLLCGQDAFLFGPA